MTPRRRPLPPGQFVGAGLTASDVAMGGNMLSFPSPYADDSHHTTLQRTATYCEQASPLDSIRFLSFPFPFLICTSNPSCVSYVSFVFHSVPLYSTEEKDGGEPRTQLEKTEGAPAEQIRTNVLITLPGHFALRNVVLIFSPT
ncbi:unnamed protein product [Calypogeia fissa]